jgi:phytoene dehydrogenase-like protein
LTAATQQDPQLQRRLQQDSIELAGKTVYLNPFLYWRRFDANTDRWLREPGQLPEDQIAANRLRFFPELAWDLLADEERRIKDGAVEMFLKSLELISTFNPELTPGQLLEVERKMAVTKKRAFERWVAKALKRRQQQEDHERRRFDRERWLRDWSEWLLLPVTRQALVPISALMVVALSTGWWLGAQQFCRQQILQQGVTATPPAAGSAPALP